MGMSYTERKRIRKSFGHVREVVPMPDLIGIQKESYKAFLQSDVMPHERKDVGLHGILKSLFPIKDSSGSSQLEFIKYELEVPKYDVRECHRRGVTYAGLLRVTLRLVTWDVDEETKARSIRDIKEQDVYMGDLPLMTESGTFVVNGSERVVVSQMHRSPGAFFSHDHGKTHASGKLLFSARIIPYRGSWVDFEFDAKDILCVRIDRRRKLPATTLLLALENEATSERRARARAEKRQLMSSEVEGLSREDILTYFYETVTYTWEDPWWVAPFSLEQWAGVTMRHDLYDRDTGAKVLERGQKVLPPLARRLESSGLRHVALKREDLEGRFLARDVGEGDECVCAGEVFTRDLVTTLIERGVRTFPTLRVDETAGSYVRDTLMGDKNINREDALLDIYRVIRPGEPPTLSVAEALFERLFFDPERYDLSAVGRAKMNGRLGFSMEDVPPEEVTTLRREDFLAIVKELVALKDSRSEVDDIDHLSNRRLRSVGELMENQYRIGLLRVERGVRERMSAMDVDNVMPHDLVNAKPVAASLREFFGSSQLSQFMDQTNPLSEVTHKRRLSALGPGGLSRERVGFEVRDVHPTHYGRICPIETPEGPNIGLINSLAAYARVNPYGFIETPYRRVRDGRATDEVVYLSAVEEGRYTIAQASLRLDETGLLLDESVPCRVKGEYGVVAPQDVDFVDVSTKQLFSVATSLIPFLENDDANRALMGSNMQRQAVPLVKAEAPLVGTGMEARVAQDSGTSLVARRGGVVDYVDGTRIVVRVLKVEEEGEDVGVDIYKLKKFQRSNQGTCINHRPLVKAGDVVRIGDIIADGPATDLGELALGRNILVAFMPWNGYNFEDSILVSERILQDDVFTSIHIEEFEAVARDTKLGQEEISRDIPNLSEESMKDLDEAGIVYVGAEVKAGDILVGKVTPKGESPMTPEEKLLKAIFGEKASDVRDSSLRLPPGNKGTVVDVRIFSRRGVDMDERALSIVQAEIDHLRRDRDDERSILERSFRLDFLEIASGQQVRSGPVPAGAVLSEEVLSSYTAAEWRQIVVEDEDVNGRLETLRSRLRASIKVIEGRFADLVEKVKAGDDLMPGVMKVIKVFVAVKRKLQPGDKMAGRHGNKGVVSKIAPVEDMPFLEDGTPVDIVLNPLGVPSRMNVGQILETHLGWASSGLGKQVRQAVEAYQKHQDVSVVRSTLERVYKDQDLTTSLKDEEVLEIADNVSSGIPFATPVFDGAREEDINALLEEAGLTSSGQEFLIDGRTGEPFSSPVTVGYIYMLKLHHLVDDKIHARSIGPYSLVTQQPLGGKAQFGGQRFGEMEVWALEAYGAAHTLQEMLTVKSDDVVGRNRIYNAIVSGDQAYAPGLPESFNVLTKELRSLGLDVELLKNDVHESS